MLREITLLVDDSHMAEVYAKAAEWAVPATPAATPAATFPNGWVRKAYMGGQSNVWRPLLHHLAERPGEWVSWPELCRAVDRTPQELAGAIGAAERRCGHSHVPYTKKWERNTRHFRVTGDIAEVINLLRKENDGA